MDFSHLNGEGKPKMVDVSGKDETYRVALASGKIYVGSDVIRAIEDKAILKGDIFSTAKIAGIMAAKKTSELIPLCHNIFLSYIDISYRIDKDTGFIEAISEVKTKAQTGAEMEAITAVLIFLETIYDMCKSIKKDMVLTDVKLLEKTGGKSGHYIYKKGEKDMAKVLSINISKKKGTPKEAVNEAVLIEDFGIENDAHAGNGPRQVSILDISSIKKMEEYGLKGLCFGRFAENITTEGLDIKSIKLGTKIRVGDTLLQISQIGKKCHGDGCEIARTVGVCIMPTEGLFAKVLKGGRIKVGDDIEILSDGE